MNISAIHAKLDDLLRVCRKTGNEIDNFLSLVRFHPDQPKALQPNDNSEGNRGAPYRVPLRHTPNNPNEQKAANAHRFWKAFTVADCIQLFIGILLSLTLIFSIKSYQVSRDATIKQLRAFVYAKEITVAGGGSNSTFILKADIQNSGSTPARKTVIKNLGVYMIPRTSMVFSLPGGPNKADGTVGLLPPGQLSTISFDISNADITEGGTSGAHNLLLFGDIHYFDVFGAEHITEFCQSSKLIVRDNATSPERWLFGACGIHNCDDESCPANE